jgi:uncharacterized membrane protein
MMHGFGYGWGDMMSSGTFLGGTGWMVFSMMGIGLLLIVGLVAWVIYTQRESLGLSGSQVAGTQAMYRGADVPPTGGTMGAETPEQIARRRYANGEIDQNEYTTIMTALRS